MIQVGALTEALIEALKTNTGQLVGDGIAPPNGGWKGGQPGQGVFVPYLVVAQGAASAIYDGLDDATVAWLIPYAVTAHGGSRKQADWMMSQSRLDVEHFRVFRFGDPVWKTIGAAYVSMGAPEHNTSVDPPAWSIRDTIALRCANAA